MVIFDFIESYFLDNFLSRSCLRVPCYHGCSLAFANDLSIDSKIANRWPISRSHMQMIGYRLSSDYKVQFVRHAGRGSSESLIFGQ